MSAKLLALVKWIGGTDDKKYTVGIPVDWIKDFNEVNFRSEKFDPDESYIVEWRNKPSPPPGGWTVYDAYVIEVSTRKSVLEKKLQALDGLVSPTKCIRSSTPPASTSGVKTDQSRKADFTRDCQNTEKTPHNNKSDCFLKQNVHDKIKNARKTASRQSQQHLPFSSDCENERRSPSRESGLRPLSPKRRKKNVGAVAPEQTDRWESALKQIQNQLTKIRKKQSSRRARGNSSSDSSSDDEMVEIGSRGSNVFITKDQWLAAKSASTFTAMGTSLLLSLFPQRVLLKSNLRGAKSKIKGANNEAPRRKALDPKILDAIYCAVRKQWKTFDHTRLGTAINNKLNSLREAHAINNLQKKNPSDNDIASCDGIQEKNDGVDEAGHKEDENADNSKET